MIKEPPGTKSQHSQKGTICHTMTRGDTQAALRVKTSGELKMAGRGLAIGRKHPLL
jgi:hypothetical protein